MATVNISLPQNQIVYIDELVEKYGFANRSELFRALIRLSKQGDIVKRSATFPFSSFTPRPLDEVRREFEKTGKYSKKFIDSLIEGLSQSSAYDHQASQKRP